jgi:membrane protein DedA with SNARE-associated domain
MYDFLSTLNDILSMLGFLLRALGFLAVGYGLGRFFQDAYQKAAWQLQIALALGFFGLLIGLTHYSSPGSAGMFALGAGIAFFMVKKEAIIEEPKPEGKKK